MPTRPPVPWVEPAPPLAGDAPSELPRRLRERRLRQITVATLVAMAVSVVPELWLGLHQNLWVWGPAALALGAVLWLSYRGRHEPATALLLGALQVMIGLMAWRNAGLRDTAVLAYPGLLIFAAMLGSSRLFLATMAATLASLALMWLAHAQGWHPSYTVPVSGRTLLNLSAIVAVTGISAWLMASDQRRATRELKEQNRHVTELQEQTAWIATHDALTGLPNRVLARDRFDLAAAEAHRGHRRIALLYLDLDNFKNINDSLGHGCGDALLQVVGERLRAGVRASDTVCRLGGDEFLLLVPDPRDDDAVAGIATQLVDDLARPIALQGVDVLTGASVGIAMYPEDGHDFESLLKTADMAMYRVKETGRNGYRFYDADMNASVVEHVQLVSAMRAALARGEFFLAYQPQYALDTGEMVGAEALLRWRHPTLGLVPPGRFIPLAERSGLIGQIGDWVLAEACRQAQAWREAGWDDLVMSVNVSPVQFRRGEVERAVSRALEASGLPARCLELELTESLLIQDTPALAETLHRLRGMLGVRFAIDDFGTGYSNLAYLKRFEVERLKIDQTFVRRLTQDGQDQAIVRAIVQMAEALGLVTVAEGIEDAGTLDVLRGMGCVHGQGFHWHPGLPAPEFEARALGRRMPTTLA